MVTYFWKQYRSWLFVDCLFSLKTYVLSVNCLINRKFDIVKRLAFNHFTMANLSFQLSP